MISRFDEYLQRYPKSDEAIEAAYLLAESLVRSAQILRQHLAKAETENARVELRDRINQRLSAALDHLRNLQTFLSDLHRDDRLDRFGQRALHDTYFEIARVLFQMEKFDEAVEAYRAATYKYPDDPQVLLAYIQMAHCYSRLGKPAEARSLLEQARVILRDFPEEVFQSQASSLQAADWEQWIQWASQMHKFAEADTQRIGNIP
ncbi:MAG: tetratricopeptide repeat protein [Planctomycetes bacterium]|nr:tetratricopeptide repeat protein [Planctomycetota bacterium]